MKPTFIQPCFIRKNTPDLRRKLEELGYYSRAAQPKMDGSNSGVLFCNKDRYSETPYGHPEEINRTIDCGANEDLFLAIAALREDSDYMQWFCSDEPDFDDRCFFVCQYDTLNEHIQRNNWDDSAYHKASVEELIEYFKII